jgi:hypothetical protein
MRLATALVAFWASSAVAADLMAVDRTIRKEPAYQSKPKYCLLVFGPEAKTRVWLVLDLVTEPWEADGAKNALYVDRNGNGDLTEPGERVTCTLRRQESFASFSARPSVSYCPHFEVGPVIEHDGQTRHTDLRLDVDSYVQKYRPCSLSVKVHGRAVQSAGGTLLRFADRPQDAPIIHFNGPLTMRVHMDSGVFHVPIGYQGGDEAPPWSEQHPLGRGTPWSLYAQLGTPGLGRGTFAALSAEAVPADAHPVADLEFPAPEPRKAPAKVRVVLAERCCGYLFHGPVQVPAEAARGAAKVTLSVPSWTKGHVTPATFEVPIAEPKPPEKR